LFYLSELPEIKISRNKKGLMNNYKNLKENVQTDFNYDFWRFRFKVKKPRKMLSITQKCSFHKDIFL